MRIIRTEKPTIIPPQLLKTNPDISLDVLHQMAKVNMAIGVGEGGCDENFAWQNEIRNTNIEIRNKFKKLMIETRKWRPVL